MVFWYLLDKYVRYSSLNVFFTVIPFKREMAVELQEKGRVRVWAQVGKFSSNCHVNYVFNENIISQGKVHKMTWQELFDLESKHSRLHKRWFVIWFYSIRNTQWTLTRTPVSSRCSWTRWRSPTKELSRLILLTAKLQVGPVWCLLEKVFQALRFNGPVIHCWFLISHVLALLYSGGPLDGRKRL